MQETHRIHKNCHHVQLPALFVFRENNWGVMSHGKSCHDTLAKLDGVINHMLNVLNCDHKVLGGEEMAINK